MEYGRFLGLVGMARKAGKLILGASMLRGMIQKGKLPSLCVISDFSSENTKKRMIGCFEYYGVDYVNVNISTEVLGKALGAGELSCFGIYDDGFANAVRKSIAL